MICFPNIKINLGLSIINRRTDGFHTIESVFVPVSCCDMLEVIEYKEAAPGHVIFTTTGLEVGGSMEDNLIVKAYHLLNAERSLPAVRVHLHKRIPMGAGLGGGSSDAAWMIRLLNQKFVMGLSPEQMENYAARLGSDCAFFIRNEPAYLLGKGHELEPYKIDLNGLYIVLWYAGVHSNTALAYQNAKPRGEQTSEQSLKTILQLPVEQWKDKLVNDFEASVFAQYPQLAQLKQGVYDSGAVYASMSGSGSAVFGLYKTKPQLSEQLRSWVCYEGWITD